MQKQTSRFRHRPLWFLSLIAFLFVLCGALLTFTLRSQASTNVSRALEIAPQISSTAVTQATQPSSAITSTVTQENASKNAKPLQSTITPVATLVAAAPTLAASTPQHTQLRVFPLSAGGPLPVPESVLHPTNIARGMLGSTLVSVYAGSMTRNPQVGILCVLREDLTTGELHLQVYQGPQTGGALTILSIQKSVLKVSNTKMQGSFDLNTNTFQW